MTCAGRSWEAAKAWMDFVVVVADIPTPQRTRKSDEVYGAYVWLTCSDLYDESGRGLRRLIDVGTRGCNAMVGEGKISTEWNNGTVKEAGYDPSCRVDS